MAAIHEAERPSLQLAGTPRTRLFFTGPPQALTVLARIQN